jgi:hypothetical protein
MKNYKDRGVRNRTRKTRCKPIGEGLYSKLSKTPPVQGTFTAELMKSVFNEMFYEKSGESRTRNIKAIINISAKSQKAGNRKLRKMFKITK